MLATAASHGAGNAETLAATTVGAAGTYYLRVQNGSSSDVVQLYSLALTTSGGGGTPTAAVTVTAPNGGETWTVGNTATVTWTSANLSQNVKIELNRAYPAGAWETLTASTTNSGSYSFTVSGATSDAARVRVTGVSTASASDTSNGNFTLSSGTPAGSSLAMTAPNGGERFSLNSTTQIAWTSTNLTGSVKIEINRNYPSGAWESIIATTSNDGGHTWVVAGATTTAARIRVLSLSNPAVGDTSNANFTISSSGGTRTITVRTPNGGETWMYASLRTITWTSSGLTGSVKIEINRNYPAGNWSMLAEFHRQ